MSASSPSSKPSAQRPTAQERVRRLLFLVPFVARNQGITVQALADALGVEKDALLSDLDLLTMVGRPPFQPDDFIDIYVDNDRVFVHLEQSFSAPPRLTASEAAALSAAAKLLRGVASDALESALTKLENVIPASARERYKEMGRLVDTTLEAPNELGPLTKAIAEKLEVELEYFSSGCGQSERRVVRPHELFSHRGQWYLQAFCLTRQDERLFRVDRIKSLSLTQTSFASSAPAGRSVPNPADGKAEVRVRFTQVAAPYVREHFADRLTTLPSGDVEVLVSGESERWLTQWVMSFGGEAYVVEPAWAREAVARAARASLSY